MEKRRQKQSDHGLDRDIIKHIQQRDSHRIPKMRVAPESRIVGGADELGRTKEIPICQGDVNRADARDEVEDRKPEKRRGEEDPGANGFIVKQGTIKRPAARFGRDSFGTGFHGG
jgi:hypothetical protein